MCYLGVQSDLVAEKKLEHGILDFTPVCIPQDQTVFLHILRHSLPSKASEQVQVSRVYWMILEQVTTSLMVKEVRKMTTHELLCHVKPQNMDIVTGIGMLCAQLMHQFSPENGRSLSAGLLRAFLWLGQDFPVGMCMQLPSEKCQDSRNMEQEKTQP